MRGQALPREAAYAQDYREMGIVKAHMDKKGVSVLFVHRNRKMADASDPFNMISGTNGIMGAADTVWVVTKDKRADDEATLHISAVSNQIWEALHSAYNLGGFGLYRRTKDDTEITSEQESICPLCGAEIKYESENIIDDDGGTFPWTCPNCGAHGKEGYRLRPLPA